MSAGVLEVVETAKADTSSLPLHELCWCQMTPDGGAKPGARAMCGHREDDWGQAVLDCDWMCAMCEATDACPWCGFRR